MLRSTGAAGHAAVVAGEDDDRVVGDAIGIESRQQVADGIVHRFNHGGVGRFMFGEIGVVRKQTFVGHDRRVHGIEREVQEEWRSI